MNDNDSDSSGAKRKSSSSFLDRVRAAKITKQKKSQTSNKITKETLKQAVSNSTRPRLLFSMDATASREDSWVLAQEITQAMFDRIPGELEIGLAYHGGGKLREMSDFTTDKQKFIAQIRAVTCLAGPTALNEILACAVDTNRLKVLIYIGDCFEESLDKSVSLAGKLALKGTRIFIFHDRLGTTDYDSPYLKKAEDAFSQIASITKGAVFPFDANSPEVVASLLEAIAYYSARGIKALQGLKTDGAKRLLAAME